MPKSFKGQKKKNAQTSHSKKRSPLKRTDKLSDDPSVLSLKRSLRIRKLCDQEPVNKPKKLKADAKEQITSNGREKSNSAPFKVVKKRRDEETFREQHISGVDIRRSVEEHCMEEKISTLTSIACRTRQSVKVNKSKSDKDASMNFREEMNDFTVIYPKRMRTSQRLSSLGEEINGQSIARSKTVMNIFERKEINSMLGGSPRERCKPSTSACTTPVSCTRPVKEGSPICMGDEYFKQSCRKSSNKSSTLRAMDSLFRAEPETVSPSKNSKRKRVISDVKVLFSHHLDRDIIKQQKKILSRLGASEVSSISEATHFIAVEFVRTKNMLEAIAFGKPIVTHLWLESCGQACCLIDEKKYILRDAKKEKEFGFNLPLSLARACHHPLLKGQRVLITPNTKPGKEILSSLVKAVHGLASQRIGRMALKDNKLPDNLLVLSCEEDYAECVPFLERGAAVYSSELLLNGIVTQRLEYERYRLFTDRFKRTRSTIWLRKDTDQYHPVTKCK